MILCVLTFTIVHCFTLHLYGENMTNDVAGEITGSSLSNEVQIYLFTIRKASTQEPKRLLNALTCFIC